MNLEVFQNKVWLASPSVYQESIEYVREAYVTNWMSTIGENIDQIEKICAEKAGCKYGVALSSGTAAIHMALKLAGISENSKVFAQSLTFGATIFPVVYEKANIILIDSEYDTWNMDPEALEKALELKQGGGKIVLCVSLFGVSYKVDEIKAICKKHNAILIEDSAESFGATYKGRPSGSDGDYSIISFNGNKIITGSSGGMLLTNDEEAARKARKWSTQSRENVLWYEHKEIGYNYRMSNVIAGVVRGQLPYLEKHIAQKKAIYERYKEGFKDLPVQMNPYNPDECEPNFWLSCLILDEEAMKITNPMEILDTLAKYNAEGRPIWKPMHMQPVFEGCPFVTREENEGKHDVARDIFRRGLCLPSDNKMTAEQQDKIIEIVKSCFE